MCISTGFLGCSQRLVIDSQVFTITRNGNLKGIRSFMEKIRAERLSGNFHCLNWDQDTIVLTKSQQVN